MQIFDDLNRAYRCASVLSGNRFTSWLARPYASLVTYGTFFRNERLMVRAVRSAYARTFNERLGKKLFEIVTPVLLEKYVSPK